MSPLTLGMGPLSIETVPLRPGWALKTYITAISGLEGGPLMHEVQGRAQGEAWGPGPPPRDLPSIPGFRWILLLSYQSLFIRIIKLLFASLQHVFER